VGDKQRDSNDWTLAQLSGGDDVDAVMSGTRQQFASRFAAECAMLATLPEDPAANPAAVSHALRTLHRLAGLGGTLGFPRVSVKAAALEDAVRRSALSPNELRRGVEALHEAFAQDAEQSAPAPPSVDVRGQGQPLRILIVEDEPVQRAIIAAQVKAAGHAATTVASGEETVAAAHAARPDIILLDVELPGINGYEVCGLLKADPALAAIPIAFLSAHAGVEDRLTGLSRGADDFLTKPIDPRELALRLQLLDKRRQPSPEVGSRDVLTYELFRDRAGAEIRRERASLALIRTPADRSSEVATILRDEIRRRDLCAYYDRSHVLALLPDTGGAAARDRIAAIVEKCRAAGMPAVYAGIAASATGGSHTLERLIEEADEALATARYENHSAALRADGPRAEAPEQGAAAPLVLVADDDPDVVRIVDAHLGSGGYRRVLAFDGTRTLEEVRAQRPDVVVLDLMMPRLTGFDVLASLREMGESRPRVIVLSARGREDDIMRAFNLGADDFMVKPFNPQELVARVARLVK
jgi:two-component system, cell cycle response regulator